jgi:hypothetical protein
MMSVMPAPLFVLITAMVPSVAMADPSGEPEQHAVCLLGNRGPSCTTVLLAEVDVRYGQDHVVMATAQAGLLVNRGDRLALGLSAGVLDWNRGAPGDADHVERFGVVVEGRGRLWVGDFTGLDLDVGAGNVGAIAGVALEYHDIIGISAGALAYNDGHTTAISANVGLRLSVWALLALGSVGH